MLNAVKYRVTICFIIYTHLYLFDVYLLYPYIILFLCSYYCFLTGTKFLKGLNHLQVFFPWLVLEIFRGRVFLRCLLTDVCQRVTWPQSLALLQLRYFLCFLFNLTRTLPRSSCWRWSCREQQINKRRQSWQSLVTVTAGHTGLAQKNRSNSTSILRMTVMMAMTMGLTSINILWTDYNMTIKYINLMVSQK